MKLLMLLCTFFFTFNAYAIRGSSNIGAVQTGAAANTVLATSGSLVSGSPNASANYIVSVVASSSIAMIFDFQAVFSGTPVSHTYLMVPAMGTVAFNVPISFAVPDGITLQVVNVSSGLLGTMQANLYWAIESFN